jgi:hypothetical protein
MFIRLLAPAIFALLLASPARAQAPQDVPQAGPAAPLPIVELRLNDGSVIYGVVEREAADRLVIRTLAGALVEVTRAQVVSIEPARGQVVDGQFWRADSNATRLFFAPTGRSLERGAGYIGVYEFLLPFVQVGVTDRLTVGAGTPLIFFGDESGRPVWVTPKYQFYKGTRTSAAVGVMHFFVLGESSRVGLAYAVATTGTDDNAVSLGAGWAYARYREDDASACPVGPPGMPLPCTSEETTKVVGSPVVMIGGERRLSRHVKFISENYAFEGGGVVSVGVRFLGERLSADLGVFAPVTVEEDFVLAPIVNFVWTFGR